MSVHRQGAYFINSGHRPIGPAKEFRTSYRNNPGGDFMDLKAKTFHSNFIEQGTPLPKNATVAVFDSDGKRIDPVGAEEKNPKLEDQYATKQQHKESQTTIQNYHLVENLLFDKNFGKRRSSTPKKLLKQSRRRPSVSLTRISETKSSREASQEAVSKVNQKQDKDGAADTLTKVSEIPLVSSSTQTDETAQNEEKQNIEEGKEPTAAHDSRVPPEETLFASNKFQMLKNFFFTILANCYRVSLRDRKKSAVSKHSKREHTSNISTPRESTLYLSADDTNKTIIFAFGLTTIILLLSCLASVYWTEDILSELIVSVYEGLTSFHGLFRKNLPDTPPKGILNGYVHRVMQIIGSSGLAMKYW